MELRGFEPLTFCMPCSMVSSDGVVPGPVAAVQSGTNVRGRVARSGEICGRWSLVWSWFGVASNSPRIVLGPRCVSPLEACAVPATSAKHADRHTAKIIYTTL